MCACLSIYMCVWVHVYRIEVSHDPSHPEFWVNLSLECTDWLGWLTTMPHLLSAPQYNDYRFAESPDVRLRFSEWQSKDMTAETDES